MIKDLFFKTTRLACLLTLTLLLTSCFPWRSSHETAIKIESRQFVNHGQPLYFVIKEVDKTEFLTDTYSDMAKEASSPSHPSCLISEPLIPGYIYKWRVPQSGKSKYLGIYFIYTHPGESWKSLVDASAKRVDIVLGDNGIQIIEPY